MPYTPSTVPDYVPKAKARQWSAVWNDVYKRCIKDGGSAKTCEAAAFRQANGVIKKNNEFKWEVRIVGSA